MRSRRGCCAFFGPIQVVESLGGLEIVACQQDGPGGRVGVPALGVDIAREDLALGGALDERPVLLKDGRSAARAGFVGAELRIPASALDTADDADLAELRQETRLLDH